MQVFASALQATTQYDELVDVHSTQVADSSEGMPSIATGRFAGHSQTPTVHSPPVAQSLLELQSSQIEEKK